MTRSKHMLLELMYQVLFTDVLDSVEVLFIKHHSIYNVHNFNFMQLLNTKFNNQHKHLS